MNYRKIYYPIRVLAVLSFIAVAIEYWSPHDHPIGLIILFFPYVALFFLAREHNYRNLKLALFRIVPAVITFSTVPMLLFGIEPDPQAGMSLMLGAIIQSTSIGIAELIILFFLNDEDYV